MIAYSTSRAPQEIRPFEKSRTDPASFVLNAVSGGAVLSGRV